MNPTPLAALLLAAALLAAADAPPEGQPPREGQPQAQRPQRDRGNAQGNGETPRVQRQAERAPAAPAISGWVYIPPQGGQNGPIPPKPDFIPQAPDQQRPNVGRVNQPQPGNGPEAQPQTNRAPRQELAQRRGAVLSPDEQSKLQEAMAKVKDDGSIKEAREVVQKAQKELQEASRKEREATEAAALKVDPSLAPVFEKMHAAGNAQSPNRRASAQPTPEQLQAFREQMRDRARDQAPVRRDEPAR
jgi:hypothetical protein